MILNILKECGSAGGRGYDTGVRKEVKERIDRVSVCGACCVTPRHQRLDRALQPRTTTHMTKLRAIKIKLPTSLIILFLIINYRKINVWILCYIYIFC